MPPDVSAALQYGAFGVLVLVLVAVWRALTVAGTKAADFLAGLTAQMNRVEGKVDRVEIKVEQVGAKVDDLADHRLSEVAAAVRAQQARPAR